MKTQLKNLAKCQSEGCESYQWSRGYCSSHYTKLKKLGILETVKHQGTPIERFEKLYRVNPVSECWEWTGAKNRGYG